jgi:hypothetical protein
MSSTLDSIAQKLHGELDAIIQRVSTVEGVATSVHEMEEQLWVRMLGLGRNLLQLHFEAQYEAEVVHDRVIVAGVGYAYERSSQRAYVSLFGEVTVRRAYYLNATQGGVCPLDAQVSLPERCYSDSVQERLSALNVWVPQAHSLALVERWLGLPIAKGSLQSSVSDQAQYVDSYYQQRPTTATPATDSLLVATADGKGIPMTRADSPPVQARRCKGDKKTAKKEAIVTALYSVAPYPRDSQAILEALLPDKEAASKPVPVRPVPSHKQTFGTLEGKAPALTRLAHLVAQRQGNTFTYRIALTDGSLALQQQMLDHLPDFTLVLDIIHVTEYLWDAANARWGETSSARLAWVRQALAWLLEDHLDDLLDDLTTHAAELPAAQQATLLHIAAYLRRNRPFMDYQRYLALGWPIGTGVIEGACRHLVKDRFEQAGMRWSKVGAQALLDLRSIAFNDDWDDFQRFRRQQAHLQRYSTPYPDTLPDILALEAAA